MAWNSNRGRQGVYKMSQKRALIICGGFFVPFLCFLVTIYNSYPQIEGEIYLKNAPNECSIKTDVHGIPHINAKDEKSGYYAMGYMHAQNRLWQMHLLRMSDQGRISEVCIIVIYIYIYIDIWIKIFVFGQDLQITRNPSFSENSSKIYAFRSNTNVYCIINL